MRVKVNIVPSHVNLWQPEELVTLRACLDHLLESKIHPRITIYQVPVQCLSIL